MPNIPINQVSRGQALMLDGEIMIIVSMEHVKPGKGPAYQQIKLRNIESGKIIEKRFRAADSIDVVDVDRQTCAYSYKNGESYVFMNNKTYEELEVHESILGDDKYYLLEGNAVTILVANGRVLGVELSPMVVLEITQCDPGVKNATATNVFKNAVVETGLNVGVPPFINKGDKIKIDTETGKYVERVATA